jgi:hypothetical protein
VAQPGLVASLSDSGLGLGSRPHGPPAGGPGPGRRAVSSSLATVTLSFEPTELELSERLPGTATYY